jgi:hypothetical protein
MEIVGPIARHGAAGFDEHVEVAILNPNRRTSPRAPSGG